MSEEKPRSEVAAVSEHTQAVPAGRITMDQMQETIEQLNVIRQFIYSRELKEGVDYGKVPGCGDKPTLLLPGAQKICMLYNVYPEYQVERKELTDSHVDYIVNTSLISRSSGLKVGSGVGSCSTLEKKYRYRVQNRVCPKCGHDTIRMDRNGGYYCWAKIGGCGSKFAPNDPAIADQATGFVENDDIADSYNTVLKIAKKRSLIDAAIGLSCISEFFTQDLEDRIEAVALASAESPEPEDKPQENRPVQEWRGHPQVQAYHSAFGGLMQESGTLSTPKEAICRNFIKTQWLKLCQQNGVEPRPDKIEQARFDDLLSMWRTHVRKTFEEKRKVSSQQKLVA